MQMLSAGLEQLILAYFIIYNEKELKILLHAAEPSFEPQKLH